MARGKGIKSLDQNSTSVSQQLDILGRNIITDAKKTIKSEHYDTGQLYKSLKYKTNYINDDKFSLEISEMYYGQYVNKMDSPGYMDKAIEDNLDDGIDDIINIEIDKILNPLLDSSGNKVRFPKKNWGR